MTRFSLAMNWPNNITPNEKYKFILVGSMRFFLFLFLLFFWCCQFVFALNLAYDFNFKDKKSSHTFFFLGLEEEEEDVRGFWMKNELKMIQ